MKEMGGVAVPVVCVSLSHTQNYSSPYALSLKFPQPIPIPIQSNLRFTSSSNVFSIHIQCESAQIKRRRFFPIPIISNIKSNPEEEQQQQGESVGVKAALSMLQFYKREISPLLPRSCRYVPTCSEYSMIAYKKYGLVKGTVLTASRLCRCNPLGGSGFDPPRWFDEERASEE